MLGSLGLPFNITELWLPGFWPHTPRVAAEAWKNASIYLYEEGLSTYNTFTVASYPKYLTRHIKQLVKTIVRGKEGLSRSLRAMLSAVDRRNVIWTGPVREHVKRTRESYIMLDGFVPLSSSFPDSIKVLPVDRDILCHVLDSHVENVGIPDIPERKGKPKVLFLGQNLSRHAALDSDEELDIFRSAVQSILDAGYEVIWKDHPRAVPPLFDRIKQIAPDNIFTLPEMQHCPVEAILPKLGVSFCVGVWSTTLFYAKAIYGIETYTAVNKYKYLIHGDDRLMEWVSLTSSRIPDLSEKLNQAESSENPKYQIT
jgi:hypothetical protein